MRTPTRVTRAPYVFTSLSVGLDRIDLSRVCSDEQVQLVAVSCDDTGEVVAVFAQGDLDLDEAVQEWLDALAEQRPHRLSA